MNYKLITVLFLIILGLYFLNNIFDGYILDFAIKFPKLIALAVGILALVFPRNYHEIPDMLASYKGGGNKRRVSESMKKHIASEQKWKCNLCHSILDGSYEIDHIIPLYKGGGNQAANLQALCRNCHGKKTMDDRFK